MILCMFILLALMSYYNLYRLLEVFSPISMKTTVDIFRYLGSERAMTIYYNILWVDDFGREQG